MVEEGKKPVCISFCPRDHTNEWEEMAENTDSITIVMLGKAGGKVSWLHYCLSFIEFMDKTLSWIIRPLSNAEAYNNNTWQQIVPCLCLPKWYGLFWRSGDFCLNFSRRANRYLKKSFIDSLFSTFRWNTLQLMKKTQFWWRIYNCKLCSTLIRTELALVSLHGYCPVMTAVKVASAYMYFYGK